MSTIAICYTLILAASLVSGHYNALPSDLKPPPAPQNTLLHNPLLVPSKFPPLPPLAKLPPPTSHLPAVPSQIPPALSYQSFTPNGSNQLKTNTPLLQQFPRAPVPPVSNGNTFSSSFPQLNPPPFNTNLPTILQNNQQSLLLPPKLPAQLPSQFPPPLPPKNNLSRPAAVPRLPPLYSAKNISNEVTRGPKTLQMIGSNNPFMLHKITDNLRPGSTTWYYRKNNKLAKYPLPQKSTYPTATSNSLQQFNQQSQFPTNNQPGPAVSQPIQNLQNPLYQLGQLNQLHQINLLNQQNQYKQPSKQPPQFNNNHQQQFNTQLNQPNQLNQYTSFDSSKHLQLANILNDLNQSHQLNQAHQQNYGPTTNIRPLKEPVIPLEVFNNADFQIQPISIPSPDSPHFETVRNQVSFLKAKHKQFFDQQQPPKQPFAQFGQQSQQQQPQPQPQPPKLFFDQFQQPEKTWLEQLQQISSSLFDSPPKPVVHHFQYHPQPQTQQQPQPFKPPPYPQQQSHVQNRTGHGQWQDAKNTQTQEQPFPGKFEGFTQGFQQQQQQHHQPVLAVQQPPGPLKHIFEINQTTQKPVASQTLPTTTRKPVIQPPVQPPSQAKTQPPLQQHKLLPASWNTLQEKPRAPVMDYDQYSAPKKTLPVQNDFVGFPPGKGSIKNELNFISTWEKAIGIIHKNDHDSDKGKTILSAGDTDDFKKIDNNTHPTQFKEESSRVEVISSEQPEMKEEKPRKKSNGPKKAHSKKRHQSKKHRDEEEAATDRPISGEADENKPVETDEPETGNQDHRPRRKRDLSAVEGTTEGIVVSPENANTAVPLETDQPEPLMAPETEHHLVEVTSQATEQPADEHSMETDDEDSLLPHAEALTSADSYEGELISGEEEEEYEDLPHAEALHYDDYDDVYLDDEAYAPNEFQSRSDSFIFEENDGTTTRPYAVPLFAERIDDESTVALAEALVDPRSLHGRDLMRFLDEAIRNSSLYLPDEAEDRSFDVVDPPTDVIKFPYYDKTEEPINVDSALRFAENLTTFSNSLYKSKSANLCNEVDIELEEEPAEAGPDGFKPVRRLKRLGDKVDCLKNKHFGKDPLDNPLFKEEFVGVARSSPDGLPSPQPQPDPSVAVFSDVIRLIKQHLNEESRLHARDVSQVLAPRQLNLSDPKVHSPNNAVLEQLRLGKRRILPKPTNKVEEVKTEQNVTSPSEQHPLRIVFPRRLNFTKTYEEAKKVSLAKLNQTKLVEQEKNKIKLNQSRTDHDNYKATLARKLNFDKLEKLKTSNSEKLDKLKTFNLEKLEKLKTPKSQRRESNDEYPYDAFLSSSRIYPKPQIFDITSYYPRFSERTIDELYFSNIDGKEKGFASKNFRTLEREADELIDSVRRGRADKAESRIINTGRAQRDYNQESSPKPYGTSYSPLYKEFQVLSALKKSRQDDQKKPPSLDQLINFYSQRRDGSSYQRSYSVPTATKNLPIFDVSTFYPRFAARGNDDLYEPHGSVSKRKDYVAKITLDDLDALQAPPKESPQPTGRKLTETDQRKKYVTPAPVRDDIADFFEETLAQPTSSTPAISPKDEHHTFKKAEPPNPDLPNTDKAALDQTAAATSVKKALADPPKTGRRKHLKPKPKTLRRPLIRYRRKKVLGYYH